MKVCQAEDGTLLLDTNFLQTTTTTTDSNNVTDNVPNIYTIFQLKQLLEKSTNISIENQILLDSKGAKVDNEQSITDYDDDENLYLFDRMSFSSKSKSQVLLKIISDEFGQLELREIHPTNTPLPEDVQKKIKSNELFKYVQQFYIQLLQAENIYKSTQNRLNYCIVKYGQMKIQNESISVALLNLEGHTKSSSASLKRFKDRFDKIDSKYMDIIQTLDIDIEKLSSIEIHPTIQTASRRTLQDCIPIQQIKLWANRCSQDLSTFKDKVNQTVTLSQQIDRDVDTQLLLVVPPVNFSMLSKLCTESENIVNNQKELVNNINRNFQSLLQMASKSESHKDVTVIVQLIETHQHDLTQLRDFENGMKVTCEKIAQSKIMLTKYLLEKLKVISTIQYSILKLNKKIQTFVSVLKNIMAKFHHVSIPKYLPGAYFMALLEIIRRKTYIRKFDAEVVRASEILSELREEETRNRKNFFKAFGKFLPPQLIEKINELPGSGDEILNLIASYSHTENNKLPNISSLGGDGMENIVNMEEIEKTFNDAVYFGDSGGSSKFEFKLYSKLLDENNLFHQMNEKNLISSSFNFDFDRVSIADSDSEMTHGSSASSSPRSFTKAKNVHTEEYERRMEDLDIMENQLKSISVRATPSTPSEMDQLREENSILKQQVLQLQRELEQFKQNK